MEIDEGKIENRLQRGEWKLAREGRCVIHRTENLLLNRPGQDPSAPDQVSKARPLRSSPLKNAR